MGIKSAGFEPVPQVRADVCLGAVSAQLEQDAAAAVIVNPRAVSRVKTASRCRITQSARRPAGTA